MMRTRVLVLTCAAAFLMAADATAQATSMAMDTEREVRDSSLLGRPAQLSLRDTTLASALIQLSEASGVPLAFSPTLIAADLRRVRCECGDVTVREALEHMLRQSVFGYKELRGEILVFRHGPRPAVQGPRYAGWSTQVMPILSSAFVSQAAPYPRPTGTITGRVVDSGTRAPVSSVQVSIVGTAINTVTDTDGRFVLTSVSAGTVTLSVSRIGYGTAQRAVTVATGETVVVNFEITPRALALDEIIVTGTAGGTQRRAVGNVVDRIDAAASLAVVPVADAQQLMAFKAPSMSVFPPNGDVGSGSAIRIRGSSTIGLTSEPLIYIDGVRMNSGFGGPTNAGGRFNSRLNDINPEDIESFEIIKGPAAATLYGTEASAGVIQIITKRGVEGAPRFDFTVKQGLTWFPSPEKNLPLLYGRDASGNLISLNLYEHEAENGLGPVFQTGHLQSYTLNVTGGMPRARYFASLNWDDRTGFVDYNWYKGLGARANLSVLPRENMTFSLNTSYMRNDTRKWQGGADDILKQFIWGSPDKLNTRTRGFLRRTPESIRDETEALSGIDRVVNSLAVDYSPASWLTQRLNLGLDVTQEANSRLVRRSPEGAQGMFGSASLGRRENEALRHSVLSVDYGATADVSLSSAITSATSVGVQYFKRSMHRDYLRGDVFPVPGFEVISSAAVTQATDEGIENATLGSYVQQQFGYSNRLFLTAAVRADDNSAFGAEFNAAIYPKASVAWVVHEEPFWNVDWVNQFRLRGAWGAAGRQPDVFDAHRLYQAVTGPNDAAGVSPSSFGNPNLKPERSEELELGFDAGLWNDRLSLEYTYYTRTTKDAIVPVPIKPSFGFPGTQILNVGQVSNHGHEITLNARLMARDDWSWEFGAQSAFMRDRVDDIGPAEFIFVSDSRGSGEHRVGYPLGGLFFMRILSATLNADGTTSNEMCDGGTGPDGHRPGGAPVPCAVAPKVFWGRGGNPTWESSVFTNFTWRNFMLHARADGRGGHMFQDHDLPVSHTSFPISSFAVLRDNPVFQAYRRLGNQPLGFAKAGFFRLRDVSLTYDVPQGWLRGVSRASVTVSGRNVALLWQEQKQVVLSDGTVVPDPAVRDPERRFTGEYGNFVEALAPPLPVFMTQIRVSF